MNVNEKGTIYYGTNIEHIIELDQVGLFKPRLKHEQFISVSVSGYHSKFSIGHPEIAEMANIYCKILNICDIKDNRLLYHDGYENTLTYVDGFGPNPSKHINSFYGMIENNRTQNTITAVIDKTAANHLVEPSQDRTHEYLSLALHSFIEYIKPEMIVGWIVPESRKRDILKLMDEGGIRRLELWDDSEFKPIKYDINNRAKYGVYPNDIEMYIRGINKSPYYYKTRYNHLKCVLSNFDDINWETPEEDLGSYIREWFNRHKGIIQWNAELYKYEYID